MLRPAAPPVARRGLQAIREVGTRLRSVVLKRVDAPLVLRPHDWVSPPVRGFGVISLWGDTKKSRECAPQVLATEIHHEAGEKGLEQGPPTSWAPGRPHQASSTSLFPTALGERNEYPPCSRNAKHIHKLGPRDSCCPVHNPLR